MCHFLGQLSGCALLSLLLLLLFAPLEFFTSVLADGFQWSLSDSKFSQVSRTRLRILAGSNVIVWIVSICPPISNPSNPLTKLLGTVPSKPTTISVIPSSSCSTALLVLFFSFFDLYSDVRRDGKVYYMASSLFLLGLVVWPGLGDLFVF